MRKISTDVDGESEDLDRKSDAWAGCIMWVVVAACNGFVLFLWVVFSSAAAAGADTDSFFVLTAIGAITPILISLYIFSRGKYGLAVSCLFLVMPSVFACLYIFG